MSTQADVRLLALALPEAREQEGHFGFSVPHGKKYKAFAWVWLERVDPRKGRVPNARVLAVRVPNLDAKEILLMSDRDTFFTEPHYDGYPAVLVRLSAIGRAELRDLLTQAWASLASKAALAAHAATVKRKRPSA